ncbi:MAG: OmpA family protein [Candidatus Omnitrophica bacterium]|nr:OmpA family protein [Candidatus Omnitrophota bacterium]
MKKAGMVGMALILLCMFLTGCATTQSEQKDFSWYGRSGAKRAPVYDTERGGRWWIPSDAPAGKEATRWGNRGYVYVADRKPVVKRVAKPVQKLQDVYFPFDSAQLTAAAQKTLKENADLLRARPRVNVILVGSASPEGDSVYNQKLSERRVNAVKNFLVNKEGISADRLDAEAKGAIPVATKAEWPSVRRVKFLIKRFLSR